MIIYIPIFISFNWSIEPCNKNYTVKINPLSHATRWQLTQQFKLFLKQNSCSCVHQCCKYFLMNFSCIIRLLYAFSISVWCLNTQTSSKTFMVLSISFLCPYLFMLDNITWLYFSSISQNGDERLTSQRNYKIH